MNLASLQSVIFDLDGTLIDSSLGVLASLSAALDSNGLKGAVPLSSALIGPPLRETLRVLCPESDEATLKQLILSFKGHYDTLGFQQTSPCPGVEEMLKALADAKISLHIATNKRQRPTLQILEALGWSGFFDHVLSPDSYAPRLLAKSAILAQLLTETNLSATDCIYIGDRVDDYKAAKEVGIPFALASWGFEEDSTVFGLSAIRLETPNAEQLMNVFRKRENGCASKY